MQYAIDLKTLIKTYRTEAGDFMALKSINLCIEPGVFAAVVGKSGCGKSTLINMIAGIDRPTSGECNVAGSPIHKYSENQMAVWRGNNLGVIYQSSWDLSLDYGASQKSIFSRALKKLKRFGRYLQTFF